MSFGYRRAEILAALANGVGLVAVAIWILVEAVQRLAVTRRRRRRHDAGDRARRPRGQRRRAPAILWRSGGESLNVRAALLHVLADLLGSLGVVVAAVLVLTLGWTRADPVIAIAIGVLVLVSSWRVLRESVGVLLEGTPEGIDADDGRAGAWPRCRA